MSKYTGVILRVGLAFVFIWFGYSQVTDPNSWTSLIPSYATDLSGLSAHTFVLINGTFEIIMGILLVLNVYTRAVAFVLFLHMLTIILDIGLTAIGVRDVGIAMSCLALSTMERNPV